MFLNIIQHLLPRARAWSTTIDKFLRQMFEAFSVTLGSTIKTFYDGIFDQIDPQKTGQLNAWDKQWGLPDVGLTTQERRDRLQAVWSALGGQDPRYIEDTLRAAGFDVYIHEWWVPGSEAAIGVNAAATPRSPLLVLTSTGIQCGEAIAQCGEASAQCGNTASSSGEVLVNKVNITYTVPADTSKWPYFIYIGGINFGDIANVAVNRKDEFENLCLKLCPTQNWLGLIINYV